MFFAPSVEKSDAMRQTLLLLFLVFTLQAKEQPFSIVVNRPFDAALFDVVENYDRTISAVGFAKQNKPHSTTTQSFSNPFDYLESIKGAHGTQMHLIKVDNQANILLNKSASLSRFNKAVALLKTPSDGYFVGGYTLDGELIVAKLSANGTIEFAKIFGTKNYDRMNNLVSLSDGGVLAVGSSFTSRDTHDDMFTTGLGVSDIFLTRFSKEGHILWSKKFGTKYDDRGIDAVEAADGSIIVISTMSYEKNKNVTLMRITENGNRLWLKEMHSKNLIEPTKIIRLRDNNFVASFIEYNAMHQEHIRLIKFDLYKNVIVDRKIYTTYPSGLYDIKEFSDGTLMGVGYVKDTFDTDALAMLLDSNLAMLQQHHYGNKNFDLFYSLAILHNSQVAAVGIHTSPDSQEKNMWLVKLNKDTTMVQFSYNSQSLYDKLCTLFAKEIKAKQLTIDTDLTIEITDPKLLFATGVYKLTPYQKQFLQKFGNRLVPFLYNNRETIQALAINGHTSSEWDHLGFEQSYLNNEKLSMQRAYEVFQTLFTQQKPQHKKWLSKVLVGSGYSFSKKKTFSQGVENKKDSRRVSFSIKLK